MVLGEDNDPTFSAFVPEIFVLSPFIDSGNIELEFSKCLLWLSIKDMRVDPENESTIYLPAGS